MLTLCRGVATRGVQGGLGGSRGASAPQNLGAQSTLFQTGENIMPTTLLLAFRSNLKTSGLYRCVWGFQNLVGSICSCAPPPHGCNRFTVTAHLLSSYAHRRACEYTSARLRTKIYFWACLIISVDITILDIAHFFAIYMFDEQNDDYRWKSVKFHSPKMLHTYHLCLPLLQKNNM